MSSSSPATSSSPSSISSTEVLFVGASLVEWFPISGKASWDKYFKPLHPVNVGIAGATTDIILELMRTGLLGKLTSARVSVLSADGNDLGWSRQPPYIYNRLQEIIKVLQAKLPGTKILLLGILPRGPSGHSLVQMVNQLMSQLDDGDGIRYLDMTQQFCLPGTMKQNPSFYEPDQLHLTEEGYIVWAENMWPLLETMLQK